MTKYKRFLRALLRKIFIVSYTGIKCDVRIAQIEQDILWVAYGEKYVRINDDEQFVLTDKGKKFVFPDRLV